MADQYSDSRTHLSKTDAFIEDYLSDVWGDSHVLNKEEIDDKNVSVSVEVKETARSVSIPTESVAKPSQLLPEHRVYTQEKKSAKPTLQEYKQNVRQIIRIPKSLPLGGTPALNLAPLELIQKQFSLVPTIKVGADSQNQSLRTQTESIIILLTNLYFLRRPLPPKVRLFILNLSEQVIDDFHAAVWLRGMSHEV